MDLSTLTSVNPSLLLGIASAFVGLGILAVVVGVYKERHFREVQVRLSEMNQSYATSFQEGDDPLTFQERVLRPLGHSLLARLGRMTPTGNLIVLRQQLRMAGNPANLAVIDFLGIKMLAAIGAAIVTALYLITMRGMPTGSAILFSLAGGMVGLYLPNFWLNGRIRARQAEVSKALPDALDMLTTMVDAGLGFDIALLRLCERWDNALTHELERVVHEMRMGVRRMDALRNLAERVDVPELRTFIAVLIQADQLGISIANILHAQSEQIRQRRRQRVEETAATMPLKMMPIIVLFIFPALFAVLLGPSIPGFITAFGG
ncbi:MAG: type II secretion system F family protein [Caldilineaceae bacterium]|nr:type II secretion system F family protein [Caldilineaceae bacterium]HRJ42421.1 type II secretion system F family protein [Caldilineaceae bacterium]